MTVRLNGIHLHHQLAGKEGPPLVLVHGSWTDARYWDLFIPSLTDRFRVVSYDRRGHSRSEKVPGTMDDDVADLVALIEHVKLGPVHLVGHTFGGRICLSLGLTRPDLVLTANLHEPTPIGVLAYFPEDLPLLEETMTRGTSLTADIDAGRHAQAARRFVEEIAFGPAAWETIPPSYVKTFTENAWTFAEEMRDNAQGFDIDAMKAWSRPLLLTEGGNHPLLVQVTTRLAQVIPGAELRHLGTGRIPPFTHPIEYAGIVMEFACRTRG